MAFAGAWRTEDEDILALGHEARSGEFVDQRPVQGAVVMTTRASRGVLSASVMTSR